jgi:hypothetical protein
MCRECLMAGSPQACTQRVLQLLVRCQAVDNHGEEHGDRQGRESLQAADLCYAQGLYNSSASRALLCHVSRCQVALEAASLPVSNGAMPICMHS